MAIINTLPANAVMVDAGANIGLVAMPVAKLLAGRGGQVHAFEVQRMLAYALSGTAVLNDLENLRVYQQALGASEGKVMIARPDYSVKQDFGLFSLEQSQCPESQHDVDCESVSIIAIDALGLPRLDFLKIDVEGMEIDVLQGAQDSISRFLPWCWVEYWKLDIKAIKSQFDKLDYRFFVMDQLNLLCVPQDKLSTTAIDINAKEV